MAARGTGAGKGSQALEYLRQDTSSSSHGRSRSTDWQDKERKWEEEGHWRPGSPTPDCLLRS